MLRRPFTMKVDPKNAVTQVAGAKAQPFKQLLAEAKKELKRQPAPSLKAPAVAKPATVVSTLKAQTAHATTQQLKTARVHADGEAQRLGNVRSEHAQTARGLTEVRAAAHETQQERSEGRLLELITRELSADVAPANKPNHEVLPQQPIAAGQHAPQTKVESTPEAKAAQAVALIEKIERFVRSQRPGLALTLDNSLGARVEIERMGPKEIALKLIGRNGPPSAEAVSRIRDELRARGLRVGALSVA